MVMRFFDYLMLFVLRLYQLLYSCALGGWQNSSGVPVYAESNCNELGEIRSEMVARSIPNIFFLFNGARAENRRNYWFCKMFSFSSYLT
jgi:hypothetical protein